MRKILKSLFCMAMICVLLGSSFSVKAAEKITPSTKNYGVEFYDAVNVYLSNKTPVDIKLGTKFFLTYTVTEMVSDLSTQSGVMITQNNDEWFPDSKGHMQYRQESALLEQGVTYFFRFEMTEEGMVCTASWAEGDESDYIGFPLISGNIQEGCKYFGVWFGGDKNTKMNGRLTRVRCYDENGTDLGISTGKSTSVATVYDPEVREAMVPNKKVRHSYSFTLEDATNAAISSGKFTKSDEVYMEYTVKSVTKDTLWQCDLIYTNSPESIYPSGVWKGDYHDKENYTGCEMLIPGVTYLVRFKLTEEGMDTMVKYTIDGETHYLVHGIQSGTKYEDCGFFSIWFGEGADSILSAEFVDVKCYDKDGNNLGIQTNQGVKITHYGGWEDYSQCIAAYYSPEKSRYIWLGKENSAIVETAEKLVSADYIIEGKTLSLTVEDKVEEYDYVYNYMTDVDGIKYKRLKDNKVKFISGRVSGDALSEVTVTAHSGYRVEEPDKPVKEGQTFVEWCYADGTAFDFDTVIMNATTLYAKWQDGNGNTYLAVDAEIEEKDMAPIIIGGVCTILVAATVTCGIMLFRKKRKTW